ncbi:MAG: hypothetical protein KAI41_11055, partial [Hyphomicrobiaceae bacterium]|nr:hypothetical protein [Hyphomicrobiaceae bacterium]
NSFCMGHSPERVTTVPPIAGSTAIRKIQTKTLSPNTSAHETDADRVQPRKETDEEREKRRTSLRPLLALKPYLLKYPGMIALAGIAGNALELEPRQ